MSPDDPGRDDRRPDRIHPGRTTIRPTRSACRVHARHAHAHHGLARHGAGRPTNGSRHPGRLRTRAGEHRLRTTRPEPDRGRTRDLRRPSSATTDRRAHRRLPCHQLPTCRRSTDHRGHRDRYQTHRGRRDRNPPPRARHDHPRIDHDRPDRHGPARGRPDHRWTTSGRLVPWHRAPARHRHRHDRRRCRTRSDAAHRGRDRALTGRHVRGPEPRAQPWTRPDHAARRRLLSHANRAHAGPGDQIRSANPSTRPASRQPHGQRTLHRASGHPARLCRALRTGRARNVSRNPPSVHQRARTTHHDGSHRTRPRSSA